MIFILDIQKTFGNNRGKFQLKKLICLGEMIFYLHAPIKNAVKTGFSLVNFRHPAVLKASQNVNG